MALKTKDGSTTRHEPSCFGTNSRALGISFELSDGAQLFAPYSFMSHVQMNHDREMVFHYTFGIVRVSGSRLKGIFDVLGTQELSWVKRSELDEPMLEGPKVSSIVFEKDDALME